MHRSVPPPATKRRGEEPIRRIVLWILLWSVCLVTGWGCGKEPPLERDTPMRKNRIPTQRDAPAKPH